MTTSLWSLVLPRFDSVRFWFHSRPEPKNRFQFRSQPFLDGSRTVLNRFQLLQVLTCSHSYSQQWRSLLAPMIFNYGCSKFQLLILIIFDRTSYGLHCIDWKQWYGGQSLGLGQRLEEFKYVCSSQCQSPFLFIFMNSVQRPYALIISWIRNPKDTNTFCLPASTVQSKCCLPVLPPQFFNGSSRKRCQLCRLLAWHG